MKKYITYAIALLAVVLTTISCSKEENGAESGTGRSGVLKMNISATRAEADGEYDPLANIVIRLWNADGKQLREYKSLDALPASMELLEGSYSVTVEAGDPNSEASFTKCYYSGEKSFDVVAGQTTAVKVLCKIRNTVVEVKFDESIAKNFGENFHAWVVASDKVDETQASEGSVPALRFTADGKGYFKLPEGVTTLAWKFTGTHKDSDRGVIIKEDILQKIEAASKYELTFRYSKDLPGFIGGITVDVDTSTDDEDDTIIFSPDPTISGDGFDMGVAQDFIPGKWTPRTYMVSTMTTMQGVTLRFAGATFELLGNDNTAQGITTVVESTTRISVTLGEEFFAGKTGGDYTATFDIRDIDNGTLESESMYRLQGLMPVRTTDYDLWKNTVTLRALVLDPEVTTMSFGLRTSGGEWASVDGVKGSDGLYTATYAPQWSRNQNDSGHFVYTPVEGTGIFAAGSYEYRSQIDGIETLSAFTTPAGDAIYNAGMDLWSTYNVRGSGATGGSVSYPNENSGKVYWVGSNNKQTANLCLSAEPAGSNGKCAKLQPQIPSLADVFATGSLFTGTFECGTGLLDMFGYARFGVQYTFSARPRGLRVHYNASINAANYAGGPLQKGETDPARIMVCITDWKDRHAVKSGKSFDESTFWDPIKATSLGEGPILGYGSRMLTQSTSGWVTEVIPIQWYDTDNAPGSGKYSLVISCVSSAYGDYLAGSTSNILYVEDFEWVY